MKRKIEIRQQASWIFRVKPRKIIKKMGEECRQVADAVLLQQACQELRRVHEKRKVAAPVKGKGKAEADMATNGDACPLHTKLELAASSSSNGCGVPSSVLSSLDMPANPCNAATRPARIRPRTRSPSGFPKSFCPKGRREGSCFNDRASHRHHSTNNEGTSGDAQKSRGLRKNLLLISGEDCHEYQCTAPAPTCTTLSCHSCQMLAHASADSNCNCSVVPPSDSGEEISQCNKFCMGHGTKSFSVKTDDAKDTETTNPNPERTSESPEDLADRAALDLLLFAIQVTAEADAVGVEEASNVPLPESRLIFGSLPIRRKRILRRARSAFRNCSHSMEEATRTPSPIQERSREQGAFQQLTKYNTECFPAKLCSMNDKDDNAVPVLRSKCGRARALPIKFCDSVLQPWY